MLRKVLVFAALMLFPVIAFGQQFGETSTTDSYTEELKVQRPGVFAGQVQQALSVQDFRTYLVGPGYRFMRKSIQTNSGVVQYYHEATIWIRSNNRVRVHVWRKLSNFRSGEGYKWSMDTEEIRNYRILLNDHFK